MAMICKRCNQEGVKVNERGYCNNCLGLMLLSCCDNGAEALALLASMPPTRRFGLDQMTCPHCRKTINRDKHSDPFICVCGWKSA